jgi:chaperonin GroES
MAATQTSVRIRPLHDRVIVQRLDEGEQKVGGIIIPDTAKEKPQQGKVIAVGKGKAEKDGKVTPLDVKEGDTILFGKYSGQEIKLDQQPPQSHGGNSPRAVRRGDRCLGLGQVEPGHRYPLSGHGAALLPRPRGPRRA